jgi:hypothetical protein
MTVETEVKANEALTLVRKHINGYVSLEYLWGEHGDRGRCLRFTEGGAARAGATLGWLYALPVEQGNVYAEHFVQVMDSLANFGRTIKDTHGCEIPEWIVQLSDDGTFGGFSLLWHRHYAGKVEDLAGNNVRTYKERGLYDQLVYRFAFNGGLLCQLAPDVFSVSLDSNPWGIHT